MSWSNLCRLMHEHIRINANIALSQCFGFDEIFRFVAQHLHVCSHKGLLQPIHNQSPHFINCLLHCWFSSPHTHTPSCYWHFPLKKVAVPGTHLFYSLVVFQHIFLEILFLSAYIHEIIDTLCFVGILNFCCLWSHEVDTLESCTILFTLGHLWSHVIIRLCWISNNVI